LSDTLPTLPLLTGQVAIVTGSAQGIGAGIAATLGRCGASVVIADLDADKAAAQAQELGAQGITAIGVGHDVTDTDSGVALAATVKAELGRIDVLVNNAGISGRVPLVEMTDRAWDSMIAVNLTGVQRTTRAIVPVMQEQRSGSVVSISSVVGRSGKANMTHYCASKFGIVGFTQALAHEMAPYGVRVNAICPGIVRTAMWDVELAEISEAQGITTEQAWDNALATVPLNRPQTPEDIGHAAAFLSSALGFNVTGQALNVDGGFDMH
jgi:meso-butanediol dehydrogenase / (S,S)-butanediol dehydrogenase / diacetyl reductase